ncbi:hypothetical protein ABPG74_019699 [Tetrahymena malaccensis]
MKSKTQNIQFLIGILSLILIKGDICDPSYYDNPDLVQCQSCDLVSNYGTETDNCAKCKPNEYFSSFLNFSCYAYCKQNKIAKDQLTCQEDTRSCIYGYQWSTTDNKCVKTQSCTQQIYDDVLGLYQCKNCSLVSLLDDCNNTDNKCLASSYFNKFQKTCLTYCGNGILTQFSYSCKSSQQCLSGYQWDNVQNKCKKCDQIALDTLSGLQLCISCPLGNCSNSQPGNPTKQDNNSNTYSILLIPIIAIGAVVLILIIVLIVCLVKVKKFGLNLETMKLEYQKIKNQQSQTEKKMIENQLEIENIKTKFETDRPNEIVAENINLNLDIEEEQGLSQQTIDMVMKNQT